MKYWNSIPKTGKIIIVIVVLLLLFWIGKELYEKAKQPDKADIDPGNVPVIGGGGSDDSGGTAWDPAPLAQELYDSMDGINYAGFWGDERRDPWRKLADLQTDAQVKQVHNAFLDLTGGESLYGWISSESPASISRDAWNAAKDRLSAVGLAVE